MKIERITMAIEAERFRACIEAGKHYGGRLPMITRIVPVELIGKGARHLDHNELPHAYRIYGGSPERVLADVMARHVVAVDYSEDGQ